MLTLRQAQLDQFAAQRRQQAELRILARLGEEYDLGEAEFDPRVLIQQVIEKALGYGIDDESDVYGFLVVCLEFGLDVDTDPECPCAQAILSDTRLTGQQKVQQLLAILDEVETLYPEGYSAQSVDESFEPPHGQ